MLRNLLYSLFFHIIFIAILILSSLEFDKKVFTTNITPLTINFLNENSIDDINELKTNNENDKVKNLTLEEKITLYSKIKDSKDDVDSIKVVYEKSSKKLSNKLGDKDYKKNVEENEFNYYCTPVYVPESRANTEEKIKLIENRLKREELRKKMKEKNAIPMVDVEAIKNIQKIEDVVKISQKPLIVKKKNNKTLEKDDTINKVVEQKITEKFDQQAEDKKNNEKTANNDINNEYDSGSISEITISDNIIDEKYNGLDISEIFNKNDYEKLKEVNDNKIDGKCTLSLREKVNIQRQIKGCYKMAILKSKKDSKAIVGLTIDITQDGIINMHSMKINKIVDNFNDEGFAIALDNAKSALVFCSPLRGLPSGKYKTWRRMMLVFDSNNLE
jgi:hypothetical protein